MAITQTRMIALIRIADNLKNQLLTLQSALSDTYTTLPPNPTTSDFLYALQTIQNIKNSISIPPADLETLADERAHFKLHASRNDRLAKRARQRRTGEPSTASLTAPDKITSRPGPFALSTAISPRPAKNPQQLTGAARPYSTIRPLSADELSTHINMDLVAQKLAINAQHARYNMPEPYADPYNDAEPLLPEHGGTPETESAPDDSLF
jgi:hypothetical protein